MFATAMILDGDGGDVCDGGGGSVVMDATRGDGSGLCLRWRWFSTATVMMFETVAVVQ